MMGQWYFWVARVAFKIGEKVGVVSWAVLGLATVRWQTARSEAA